MTAKQSERLIKEFRTYLDTVRDAAIRCKGKAEVTGQCDADTEESKQGLTSLFNGLSNIIKVVDELIRVLPALEALLAAKKTATTTK